MMRPIRVRFATAPRAAKERTIIASDSASGWQDTCNNNNNNINDHSTNQSNNYNNNNNNAKEKKSKYQ